MWPLSKAIKCIIRINTLLTGISMVSVLISVWPGCANSLPPCSFGDPCGVAIGVASVCVIIGGGAQYCLLFSSFDSLFRPNSLSEINFTFAIN